MTDLLQSSAGQYVVDYGRANITLLSGWVSTPNVRSTMDIVWSCTFTIALSSWSILCLNLPAQSDTFWRRMRRKFQWTLLTIMGPEIVIQLSLGEWLVARKWYKEFQKNGHLEWTMTHSFYANMGGIIIRTPDEGNFPVNAGQLHYLIKEGHIECPKITKRSIQDRNKADALIRILTLGQTLWFLFTCVGRGIQGLTITTLELSTLAFISSAVGTFIFWYHKPMDVETFITINMETTIAEIHAKEAWHGQWIQTPLEFVGLKREWPWNIYWRYGITILHKLHLGKFVLQPERRPIERVPDDHWPEPTLKSLPILFFFHMAYACILIAGWNLDLPTNLELLLWRIASCIQLGTIFSGWVTMPLHISDAPPILRRLMRFFEEREWQRTQMWKERAAADPGGRWYENYKVVISAKKKMHQVRTLISEDPDWTVSLRTILVYEIVWMIYLVARMYIIVEDVVSLRAMPVSAYQTVDWSSYLPHL